MNTSGILNPHLLSLLARIRHTNQLVIADHAFPYWPNIETVDLSLVRGIPTIPQVLDSFVPKFKVGPVFMAAEFYQHNTQGIQTEFQRALAGAAISFEPHDEFKKRLPGAIGLIRTGDTTMYGNLIIESA